MNSYCDFCKNKTRYNKYDYKWISNEAINDNKIFRKICYKCYGSNLVLENYIKEGFYYIIEEKIKSK